MKRFLFLMLIIPQLIFAEDIYFKVIETTPAWTEINFPKPGNISGEIQEGSIVKGHRGVKFSSLEGINILFQEIFYNGKRMLIYANSIIPMETQDLFDENLLHNTEKPLISSFYINALRSNNREMIYLHDKPAWEEKIALFEEDLQYDDWWFYAIGRENLTITQTALTLMSDAKDGSELLIKNIKKTGLEYIVTVKEITLPFRNWWNWPKPEERELFTVLLIPDGDYIDMYLENKNTLIDTFVFVNEELIAQLNNLIDGNIVNLSRITWPHRADGSTDYSIPALNTLEDVKQPESIELSVDSSDAESQQTVQNSAKKSAMPLWAWFAVIGGTVAVAGGVVFVVKRKK